MLSAILLWAGALWLATEGLSSQVPLAFLPAFIAYRPWKAARDPMSP